MGVYPAPLIKPIFPIFKILLVHQRCTMFPKEYLTYFDRLGLNNELSDKQIKTIDARTALEGLDKRYHSLSKYLSLKFQLHKKLSLPPNIFQSELHKILNTE